MLSRPKKLIAVYVGPVSGFRVYLKRMKRALN